MAEPKPMRPLGNQPSPARSWAQGRLLPNHRGWLALVLVLCAGMARAQVAVEKPEHQNPESAALQNPPTAVPDAPTAAPAAAADPNAYTIGEQDTLTITVWKEKELSGSVVVRPDGKITVPLVGDLSVVGMTPVQVQGILTDKLKPFVTVPQVTV